MNTVQEEAWAGDFGDEYQKRSPGNEEANFRMFKRALFGFSIYSAIELGAGMGANLRALKRMRPQVELGAVEINRDAALYLRESGGLVDYLFEGSILDWEPKRTWDMAMTKGVLIHIDPDHLPMVYELLHRAAKKWIFIAEYYNPRPVSIPYRGHENLLHKRDFAGEMLDRYKDLRLIDYGFVYHRDAHPQDDLTWFLLEKTELTALKAAA